MAQGARLAPSCFVWYACMDFTMKALAAAALGLHWSNIMVVLYEVALWLHYSYIMVGRPL